MLSVVCDLLLVVDCLWFVVLVAVGGLLFAIGCLLLVPYDVCLVACCLLFFVVGWCVRLVVCLSLVVYYLLFVLGGVLLVISCWIFVVGC